MSSPYDESLLASAPKATKAQLQDGYNPELLAEKTSSTPTSAGAEPAVTNARSPVVQEEQASPLTGKKIPFYRTKQGIIIIVVVVIVIIAAVVGGAVGGTRKKESNTIPSGSGSFPPLPLPSSTSSAPGQAAGLDSNTNTSTTTTTTTADSPATTIGPTTTFGPTTTITPGPGR